MQINHIKWNKLVEIVYVLKKTDIQFHFTLLDREICLFANVNGSMVCMSTGGKYSF